MVDEIRELSLDIDENNLLDEWKGQAAMMLNYSIQLADAMQTEDEARAKLTVVAAEIEHDVRTDPETYNITKVTEASVTAAIPVQPEHKIAVKKLNKARHNVRILRAAVEALSHRKSSLQGMTDVFMRQWHADPKSRAQPKELREAAKNRTTKSVRSRRRRREPED